jgi:hypothetical protein
MNRREFLRLAPVFLAAVPAVSDAGQPMLSPPPPRKKRKKGGPQTLYVEINGEDVSQHVKRFDVSQDIEEQTVFGDAWVREAFPKPFQATVNVEMIGWWGEDLRDYASNGKKVELQLKMGTTRTIMEAYLDRMSRNVFLDDLTRLELRFRVAASKVLEEAEE